MAKFTVDTHLFRELGDLLVGRDSTALVELIKNSYDADATFVSVYGEALNDLERGFIRVVDDGIGMTDTEFEQGFLRIASRAKDQGKRISKRYKRRFTGSKGIGRLAAHKLARFIEIYSVARQKRPPRELKAINASIDWDIVESRQTLDDLEETSAIQINLEKVPQDVKSGTVITLSRLRRRWTPKELGRFLLEIQTFSPPPVLINLPKGIISHSLLFAEPKVYDTTSSDPGFHIDLEGDFTPGDDYWQYLAQAANWVIEIDALSEKGQVLYAVAPTRKTMQEYPAAEKRSFSLDHPNSKSGPFFQARILVRKGHLGGPEQISRWGARAGGIRIFVEGFRVLPYGEPRNDWLSLDADYARRSRTLDSLQDGAFAEYFAGQPEDKDEALSMVPHRNYYGAVFLTQVGASTLRMLVNREGFVPEAALDTLTDLVRKGVDLCTRVQASITHTDRIDRKEQRAQREDPTPLVRPRQAIDKSISRAKILTSRARQLVATGDAEQAAQVFSRAVTEFEKVTDIQDRQFSESSMLGVLASVGTQMAAFIHEINGLLGMIEAIDTTLSRIRQDPSLTRSAKRELAKLQKSVGQLQRSLGRHASYLVDVVTPDARRRRSRQKLAERFDAGKRLVEYTAEKRAIRIINKIPLGLKSPPMFPAELTAIFSNLLTNAVKAAGWEGKVYATAKRRSDGTIALRVENTGIAVNLSEAERWFKPFESTTIDVDPILGQGMGLGLPITRNLLEEYGAEIRFVPPGPEYTTAIEIIFPQ